MEGEIAFLVVAIVGDLRDILSFFFYYYWPLPPIVEVVLALVMVKIGFLHCQ